MKRLLKWLALCVLGVVVVLVAAVLILPNVIDWNRFKPEIAAQARKVTGRDVAIDGDIRLSLWPNLEFAAAGVRVANAPGASSPEMLQVANIAGKLRLWPLVRHELAVDRLIIDGAAMHLAVDKNGTPNWQFRPSERGTAAPKPASAQAQSNWTVRVGEFKLARSALSYANAATGQNVEAKDINLAGAMADPAQPATLNGQMTVNAEPVTLEALVDSPRRLTAGEKANAKVTLGAPRLHLSYAGSVQEKPTPGLDGDFSLDVPSVAGVAAWLGRPFAPSQPDPGPLAVKAQFATDGSKALLKQATVTGTGLDVKADGSLDASGKAPKATLHVTSGVLDLARYLPAHARTTAQPAPQPPARTARPITGNPLSQISSKPFDLEALRAAEIDATISIAGIKALGYEVGRLLLEAKAKGGTVSAELRELALYGGNAHGAVKLDATGQQLGAQSDFKADGIKLDALARAAGKSALPATGVASAAIDAAGRGANPRDLVSSLSGKLRLDLGGMEIKEAQAGTISGIKLAVDLPGMDRQPSLDGDVVYNKQPVTLAAKLDTLRNVLSGKRFKMSTALTSNLVTANYDGGAQLQPVPALDGTFDVDIGSVGKLAAWLGKPLPATQPDPGPLKIKAPLVSDRAKMTLKEATIEGKAINAKATAELDRSQQVPSFDATLDIARADLNAYLPPSSPSQTKAAPAAPAAPATAGWSDAPLNLQPLSMANGNVLVRIADTRYRDLTIRHGALKAALSGGVLKATLEQVALGQGTIDGGATLSGASRAAKLDYQLSSSGIESQDLLKSFAGTDRLSGKVDFKANGSGSGASEKELVASLGGSGAFKFTDGAIHGINLAEAIRQARSLGAAASATEKTDFAELSGSYTITKGRLENKDLSMLAPLLRLSGAGTVDLPQRAIDYRLEAKLVGTLQGEGGAKSLAGLPIPVTIKGSWSAPSYGIDWQSVLGQAAADPERLKQLPQQFRGLAKGLNVPIPGASQSPGLGSSSAPGANQRQSGSNPTQKTPGGGVPSEILKSIPGLGK